MGQNNNSGSNTGGEGAQTEEAKAAAEKEAAEKVAADKAAEKPEAKKKEQMYLVKDNYLSTKQRVFRKGMKVGESDLATSPKTIEALLKNKSISKTK